MNLASMQAMEKALDSMVKKFAWLKQDQERRYKIVFDLDGRLMTADFYPMNEVQDPLVLDAKGGLSAPDDSYATSKARDYVKSDSYVLTTEQYNQPDYLAKMLETIGERYSSDKSIQSPLLNVHFLESNMDFPFFNLEKDAQFKFVSLISKN